MCHNLDNRTALAGNLYNLPTAGEIFKFRAPEGKENIINLKYHISVKTILFTCPSHWIISFKMS